MNYEETVTVANKKYRIDLYCEKIKVGDICYDPLLKDIVTISEDDNLIYVNDNFYLIKN